MARRSPLRAMAVVQKDMTKYGIQPEDDAERSGEGTDSDIKGTPAPNDVAMMDESCTGSDPEAHAGDANLVVAEEHPFSSSDKEA